MGVKLVPSSKVKDTLAVFENGPKTEEAAGDWRKLHEERRHLCPYSHIIKNMKSRSMRWVVLAARMGR
jgi:hypothetical protein